MLTSISLALNIGLVVAFYINAGTIIRQERYIKAMLDLGDKFVDELKKRGDK